jgi:hypothetical protein
MFLLNLFANSEEILKNTPFSKEAMGVLYQSLDVMWKAMGGIFIVILVFYLIIKLLGKIPTGD